MARRRMDSVATGAVSKLARGLGIESFTSAFDRNGRPELHLKRVVL